MLPFPEASSPLREVARVRSAPNRVTRVTRVTVAGFGFLVLLLLSLGAAWGLSRVQYRERPRWHDGWFPSLDRGRALPAAYRERWVVAVHPRCGHCLTSLRGLAEARERTGAAVRVTALLVDTGDAPPDGALARTEADESRWDRDGRWRHRWGHRVYGEVMCFDAGSRLRRTLPPLASAGEAVERLAAFGLTRGSAGEEEPE